MFEKVNPCHPDKVADRLAGAVVDLVYERAGGLAKANPRVAVEVLAGHGKVDVQIETSLGRGELRAKDIDPLIHRIFGKVDSHVLIAPQDVHLSDNQTQGLRCGDNGIFKGCPTTNEQKLLADIAGGIYERWPYDGKYIIHTRPKTHEYFLTICQSHTGNDDFQTYDEVGRILNMRMGMSYHEVHLKINPLGPWTGGINVDCGATNRKLGSDMGDAVTGGGLIGKDLSKADVSVNIMCHLLAQKYRQTVTAMCSIGDEEVTFHLTESESSFRGSGAPCDPITMKFSEIVEQAREYIQIKGGFEKFAEWGLIRP